MKKGIIIHCSDSPHGRGTDAEEIHRWHTSPPRNWDGIGYHFVITEDGAIENGRPIYWTGAHAKGYNHYIGICLIGVDEFTKEQFDALAELIETLDEVIDIEEILGHYDVSSKTCPNFNVVDFMVEYGLNKG